MGLHHIEESLYEAPTPMYVQAGKENSHFPYIQVYIYMYMPLCGRDFSIHE